MLLKVELLMLGQVLVQVMPKVLQKLINKPSGAMPIFLGNNSSLKLNPTKVTTGMSMVSLKQLFIFTPP